MQSPLFPVFGPMVLAFVISTAACPVLIPFLKRLKFGQQVRDDGPQAHLKKAGTPTMGGIAFLAAILVTGAFFAPTYPRIIPVLLMTAGFGVIGFLQIRRAPQLYRGRWMALAGIILGVMFLVVYAVLFSRVYSALMQNPELFQQIEQYVQQNTGIFLR